MRECQPLQCYYALRYTTPRQELSSPLNQVVRVHLAGGHFDPLEVRFEALTGRRFALFNELGRVVEESNPSKFRGASSEVPPL